MDSRTPSTSITNRLLASLDAADYALIQPDLEPLALPVRTELEQAGKTIRHLYFIEHGIASVVATSQQHTQSEIGLIGLEGMSGVAVILGSGKSAHQTFMQAAGDGQRIAVGKFRACFGRSATLRDHFLRYVHTFTIQVANTAAANARGSLEERLARWILMAQDRLRDTGVPLTHEFLAIMLGVRRAGVTDILRTLAHRGLISKGRPGLFTILDRKGLLKIAGRFYGGPEREYKRIMANG